MKWFLFALMIAFAIECGFRPTILGEWKAVRDYDFFHEEWRSPGEDVSLFLLKDGKYRIVKPGADDKTGTFTIDEAVEPHRIVLTDDADGKVAKGIYRLDGNKLMMRASDRPGREEFPKSFDPGDRESTLDLIEFERK